MSVRSIHIVSNARFSFFLMIEKYTILYIHINMYHFVVVVVQLLRRVQLSVTLRTVACQAPLSSTVSFSLLKFMSIESMMLSDHLILCCPFSFCLQSLLASESFPMSWLFALSVQSIGASASASVLPVNIQGWFPLGLNGLISLLSKGLSRAFSSTTIQKPRFFSTQSSLWSNYHIHTWLLEKPLLWLYGPLLAKWCLCFLIC